LRGPRGYIPGMDAEVPDDLITTRQAARILRADPMTVRRWVLRGRLRGWRRGGGQYLVSERDVRAQLVPARRQAAEVAPVSPRAQAARDRHTAEVLRKAGYAGY
jgi:excisionase family DNA binding protein